MQPQGNGLKSTTSAGRSFRHCGWTGALLASSLLYVATEAAAQGTGNPQLPNFGSTRQTSSGKWYSKYVPWKKSTESPQFKLPPKRAVTDVEEPSDEVKDEGQLSFARLAERRGQPEQAKSIYEAFVKKQSDNPLPFHRLGVMAAKQGDFEQCDHYLSKAFHLDQNNPELLADIGYSMYLRGLLPDAEKFYRRALDIDRDHEAAANNLAMLLAETNRRKESLAVFKRVNDEAKAYANQGYVLAQMGELEEAKKYFNHALTIDGTLKQAATGLLQVAEYQEHMRTAPNLTPERVPDQLVEASQPPTELTPTDVAPPSNVAISDSTISGNTISEQTPLVVIQDKDRPIISTPPLTPTAPPSMASLSAPRDIKQDAPPRASTPTSSPKTAASSPPPIVIEDAKPRALPQIATARLANERAQDISVRESSRTSPLTTSAPPQVIRQTNDDRSPPPVMIEDAEPRALPQIANGRVPNQRAQDLSVRDSNRSNPLATSAPPQVIRRTSDDRSPPPVMIEPVTTWPGSQPLASPTRQLVQDYAFPNLNPANDAFTTRVSDISFSESIQSPPAQTVPESLMPTTRTQGRTGWGGSPNRPAEVNFESQQPIQPLTTGTMNWNGQPHSNIALKHILPASQFQPPAQTQPIRSTSAEPTGQFGSVGDE